MPADGVRVAGPPSQRAHRPRPAAAGVLLRLPDQRGEMAHHSADREQVLRVETKMGVQNTGAAFLAPWLLRLTLRRNRACASAVLVLLVVGGAGRSKPASVPAVNLHTRLLCPLVRWHELPPGQELLPLSKCAHASLCVPVKCVHCTETNRCVCVRLGGQPTCCRTRRRCTATVSARRMRHSSTGALLPSSTMC